MSGPVFNFAQASAALQAVVHILTIVGMIYAAYRVLSRGGPSSNDLDAPAGKARAPQRRCPLPLLPNLAAIWTAS